jgi:hypothetical protein
MDLSGRPRFKDFESRIGTRFQVKTSAGDAAGEWSLDVCELLPKPPLETLADVDCFTLAWSGTGNRPQAVYLFEAADGFTATLFAVPVSNNKMWVTIN